MNFIGIFVRYDLRCIFINSHCNSLAYNFRALHLVPFSQNVIQLCSGCEV